LTLHASSFSYGRATAYLPVIDLLKGYLRIDERDDTRSIRAKVIGHLLALDDALKDMVPPVLWLLDALPEEDNLRWLEPMQRRQYTLDALKRLLLRESLVQPLVLVFEDLHWIGLSGYVAHVDSPSTEYPETASDGVTGLVLKGRPPSPSQPTW
jgi:hypothetical protein